MRQVVGCLCAHNRIVRQQATWQCASICTYPIPICASCYPPVQGDQPITSVATGWYLSKVEMGDARGGGAVRVHALLLPRSVSATSYIKHIIQGTREHRFPYLNGNEGLLPIVLHTVRTSVPGFLGFAMTPRQGAARRRHYINISCLPSPGCGIPCDNYAHYCRSFRYL